MRSRRYPPAYFRYFRARLLNLTRPAFWGTAIFLSVTGLAIREFWANPELLTGGRNQKRAETTQENTNSRLSPEERAVAADIDNLPVLFFDFEQAVLPTLNSARTQANQKITPKKTTEQKNQPTQTKAPTNNVANAPSIAIDNPFLKQAESLLKLDLSGSSSGNNSNPNNRNVMVNPLEAELNPEAHPGYSSITGKSTNPTSLETAINQSRNANSNNPTNSWGSNTSASGYIGNSGMNQVPVNNFASGINGTIDNSGYSPTINSSTNYAPSNNASAINNSQLNQQGMQNFQTNQPNFPNSANFNNSTNSTNSANLNSTNFNNPQLNQPNPTTDPNLSVQQPAMINYAPVQTR